MTKHVICPNCGARNAIGALWCGQCYRPFEQDGDTTKSDVPETEAAADGQMTMELPLPEAPRVSGSAWICSVCGTSNPLAESICSACGSSIFETFMTKEDRHFDPRRAALRGLLLPGLGHAYAGQTLLGVSIGALVAVSIALGAMLMALGVVSAGVLLVLVGVGVWAVGVLDAVRWAGGQTDEVVLRPHVLTAIVGVVLVILIIVAVSTQGEVQQ